MSNLGTFTMLGKPEKIQPLVDEIKLKKYVCIESRLAKRLEVTDWRTATGYLVSLRESGIITDEDSEELVEAFELAPKEPGRSIGFAVE